MMLKSARTTLVGSLVLALLSPGYGQNKATKSTPPTPKEEAPTETLQAEPRPRDHREVVAARERQRPDEKAEESRRHLYAARMLEFSFAKPLSKADVIEKVRGSQAVSESVRQKALALAERFADERATAGFRGKVKPSTSPSKPDQTDKIGPAGDGPRIIKNSIGMPFVLIPAGQEFEMGAPDDETDAHDSEKPRHRVRISRSFLLGQYEVTQGEFEKVLGFNPSSFSSQGRHSGKVTGMDTSRFPVEDVTWYDTLAFCNKLGELEGRRPCYELSDVKRDGNSIVAAVVKMLGGDGYRLPTEAEWECAARAGTTTVFPHGNSLSYEQANFGDYPAAKGKSLGRPAAVGSYAPNRWGLQDTAGNVFEWVWDGYDEKWYGQFAGKTAVDPTGSERAPDRILRGGGWGYDARFCTPASRVWNAPGERNPADFDGLCGFRPALGRAERAKAESVEPR